MRMILVSTGRGPCEMFEETEREGRPREKICTVACVVPAFIVVYM